jgi:HD-GYP domain-containing protein (c-di-GMP phosphodiesterase class II)
MLEAIMRLLSIDNLSEKMQLAKNIYSADGNVLLAEGSRLNPHYILRLKEFGISSLYIVDNQIGKIEIDELVKTQTKNEITKISKEAMTNIRNGQSFSGQKIQNVVKNVMEELLINRDIGFNLVDIRAMNDYHFAHNVTVCVLTLMTGITIGYNDSKLKQSGTGAILHDIGKAKISESILNKKGKLTLEEYLEIQKHPQIGYDVLKKSNDINETAKFVPWQHHERFDGTGYPNGLKGNQIHEFARIATLADVYDAMSTDRIYRKRFLPHEVIEYIRDKGGEFFDPELAKAFLQNIAPFPIGSMVLLNTGEKAVVIKIPKDFPARPVVKTIFNPDGEMINTPLEKDLKADLTLFIVKAFKDGEC